MGTGLRPIRGDWTYRQYTTLSTATFQKFAPLSHSSGNLNSLKEYVAGANEKIVGIAMSGSTESFPTGKILVAIPGFHSSFVAKVQTGVAASALSHGACYDLEKSANNFRIDTDSTSSMVCMITGDFDSATSEVEAEFIHLMTGIGSNLSVVNA